MDTMLFRFIGQKKSFIVAQVTNYPGFLIGSYPLIGILKLFLEIPDHQLCPQVGSVDPLLGVHGGYLEYTNGFLNEQKNTKKVGIPTLKGIDIFGPICVACYMSHIRDIFFMKEVADIQVENLHIASKGL